ncbi:hypothetical protein [Lacunimicrobium album]
MNNTIAQLVSRDAATVKAGLVTLNDRLGAIASGYWHVTPGSHLDLVAYSATDAITQDVQEGFQDATRHVKWEQNKLGIVAACWERKIVPAMADPSKERLTGSADWLVRFGAKYSLSCPVIIDGEPQVVLAIAFPDGAGEPAEMIPSLEVWRSELAEQLSLLK